MTKFSSYVQHLPPVLWSDADAPAQFLGRMLRIFERLLTGLSVDTQVAKEQSDLKTGQTVIQLEDTAGLIRGSIIQIQQGLRWEDAVIEGVDGQFVTLSTGLLNDYSL